jgi:hypothetical protein
MQFMFAGVTNFNQCLSTWADKTPTNVNVKSMFASSGCPNQNVASNVAPWCQGEDEQCLAPSDAPSALPTSASSTPPTSASSATPTKAIITPIAPTAASNISPKKKSKKSKK